MVYFIIYGILLVCSFIELSSLTTTKGRQLLKLKDKLMVVNRINIHTVLLVFCAVILLLFAGTRYQLGIDYVSYRNIYEQTKLFSSDWDWIKTFSSLGLKNEITLYVIFALSSSFNIAILLFSIISIIPKTIVLNHNASYPVVGLFVYFLLFFLGCDMGVIRQCAAMAFIFASYRPLAEGNFKKFLLFIVIAFFWHRTSIVFFPAFFLSKIKLRPFAAAIAATLCIPFAFFDMTSIMNLIIRLMPDVLAGKYAVRTFEFASYNMGISSLYRIAIFWIVSYLVWKYVTNSKSKDIREDSLVLKAYTIVFFGTCGFYLLRSIYAISGRGMYYYFIFDTVLISNLLSKIKKNENRYIFFLLFVALYSARFFSTLNGYVNFAPNSFNLPYLPYKSFLFT
ncbi:EpsG family protein [Clostridiaceae bacterium]|nr:EpsG family protein [Clostridiaceae bacterium]RKI17424.1 EpsG family protein [bacterium 1XD21-70]